MTPLQKQRIYTSVMATIAVLLAEQKGMPYALAFLWLVTLIFLFFDTFQKDSDDSKTP